MKRMGFGVLLGFISGVGAMPAATAGIPDHPIITEVYTDPPGANDGPVGRDPSNFDQEYIEIYLPPMGNLDPTINPDALRLTFYEVEGDFTSSGLGLVNYRFDLPMFDLDLSNGITPGAIPRPASGVVVLGWVDYVGDPPTGLAGTPSARVGLVNGGILGASGYTFIAINGHHFGGTTNFPVLDAESLIDLPCETRSGVIQNGSGVYLLVDRDSPGYVELYDDRHVPTGGSANPNLPSGAVLMTSALFDAFAVNDHNMFDVLAQPYDPPTGNDIDLETVLPLGGAFSLLCAQVPERSKIRPTLGIANGYARFFVDIAKTTENGDPSDDDPVSDALNAYRHIRNDGPFFPTPGRAALTTSAPELSVALPGEQTFGVLPGTTGRPGLLAANSGGDFGIDIAATPGGSSNPAAATFATAAPVTNVRGQTLGLPSVAITVRPNAAHGQSATTTATVSASNTKAGAPAVLNPVQVVMLTATVLSPTRGQDANGQPFQTTVFMAVQGIPRDAGVTNEFLTTDLGAFVAANLGTRVKDTLGNGEALRNPATNLSDSLTMLPMVAEFPADPSEYINRPGPAGRLDLVQTILQSAEMQSGADTYDDSFNATQTAVNAISFNIPDTKTYDGNFRLSEIVHFVDERGFPADVRSGLANVTTSRTFEFALIDTNVRFFGNIETGATDDFGVVVEVRDTEPGSPVVRGEFVFLSFTGGLQGADIDSLQVPPGLDVVANALLFDLDNLHDVLGIRSIERIILIESRDNSGEADIVEAFTLNPAASRTPTLLDPSGPIAPNSVRRVVRP